MASVIERSLLIKNIPTTATECDIRTEMYGLKDEIEYIKLINGAFYITFKNEDDLDQALMYDGFQIGDKEAVIEPADDDEVFADYEKFYKEKKKQLEEEEKVRKQYQEKMKQEEEERKREQELREIQQGLEQQNDQIVGSVNSIRSSGLKNFKEQNIKVSNDVYMQMSESQRIEFDNSFVSSSDKNNSKKDGSSKLSLVQEQIDNENIKTLDSEIQQLQELSESQTRELEQQFMSEEKEENKDSMLFIKKSVSQDLQSFNEINNNLSQNLKSSEIQETQNEVPSYRQSVQQEQNNTEIQQQQQQLIEQQKQEAALQEQELRAKQAEEQQAKQEQLFKQQELERQQQIQKQQQEQQQKQEQLQKQQEKKQQEEEEERIRQLKKQQYEAEQKRIEALQQQNSQQQQVPQEKTFTQQQQFKNGQTEEYEFNFNPSIAEYVIGVIFIMMFYLVCQLFYKVMNLERVVTEQQSVIENLIGQFSGQMGDQQQQDL